MPRLRLGILDRQTEFGSALAGFLSSQGCSPDLHTQPDPLIRRAEEVPLNLLVLHDATPGEALAALHQVRAASRVPCVVIGSADDPDRSVAVLEAGADDLMPRCMPLPTILARIRAVVRRGVWGLPAPLANGAADAAAHPAWCLLRGRRELRTPDGSDCRLTTAEYDLFCLLVDQGPATVTREAIARDVFRRTWRGDDRTVDNLVVRLRRKLGTEGHSTIRTVQGRGYAFVGFRETPLRQG
jgi:DNA-binding response OmpR family regulator